MAEKRKRSQNFTLEEKDKLVNLLFGFKNIILNKKTDGRTNQAKNEAWLNICSQYNSTGNMYRSKDALIRVWEKMKSDAKTYNSRNMSCTIGGPSATKTDPILEQVCDLMDLGCTSIADVLDSDSLQISEESQDIIDIKLVRDMSVNEVKEDPKVMNTPPCSQIPVTPLWKRCKLKENNHPEAEVVSPSCTEFQGINNKQIEIEDLRRKLLEEEIEFKRSLYNIQLESARKDLEIKIELLNQIKGFQEINNKKIEIEDLRRKLSEEEIEFKRNLYNIQLESARKDLEIEISQLKGGNFNLKNLFGVPNNE